MTTSSTANATPYQLHHVHDLLRDPLTGKQVMVPLTTKAFFAGRLEPEIGSKGQEQVLLKLTKEHFVTLDRDEASNVLEKRILSSKGSLRIAPKEQASASSSLGGSSDDASVPSFLPFFEIREEIDNTGKEVSSEAVNVAQELEYLRKKEEESRIDSSVFGGLAKVDAASNMDITDDYAPNPSISDEAFDELSSRLEKLAQLEEEAENKNNVNQFSAKSLQGSGWSKGFLNSKPKTTDAKQISPTKLAPTNLSKQSTPNKKVAFSAENKIHEIPRTGQRSFTSTKKPATGPRPFEKEIFSGIIQERSMGERPVGERPQPEVKKRMSKFSQERQEDRG